MEFRASGDGFPIWHRGQCLLFHGAGTPCVSIGRGEARFDMRRGNFDIRDAVLSRTPLPCATERDRQVEPRAQPGGPVRLVPRTELDGPRAGSR